MPLPRGDEYLTAIQNPRIAFNDSELKNSIPETDQFGIPKPYSGGFTTTFHLRYQSQEWAARCFTRAIADLQKRYEAIGRFLQKNSDGSFVKATCLSQGIRIGNQWHPIIKMQWLDGIPLNIFISNNISNVQKISKLIPEFVNLIRHLEQLGIAHGDLQHGNILVKNSKLFLIDYDGFFLPELSSLKTNEMGHLNYQHPSRNSNHYNPHMDRFSSIVIYIGLQAICISPKLWSKYDNSENILFRANDFFNVDKSPLIKDLSSISQLSIFVERFRAVCGFDFDKIPTLDQFINGNFTYSSISAKTDISGITTARRSQYITIDASRIGSLSEHIGERVDVIGLINDYHSSKTRYRQPFLFLNFGSYPHQTFTLVLWKTSLDAFQRANTDPHSLVGKWVKVTGVIGSYRGRPQMTIEMPSQIQILSGENEVRQLIGIRPISSTRQFQPKQSSPRYDERIFNTIYQNRKPTPLQKVPQTPVSSSQQRQKNTSSTGCLNMIGIFSILILVLMVIFFLT